MGKFGFDGLKSVPLFSCPPIHTTNFQMCKFMAPLTNDEVLPHGGAQLER